MWYRYPGTLALLTLLTTSQRDTLAWRAPHPVMPIPRRSLRYQYPQLPHIATLRAGRQAEGWVYHCVRRHPLSVFMVVLCVCLLAFFDSCLLFVFPCISFLHVLFSVFFPTTFLILLNSICAWVYCFDEIQMNVDECIQIWSWFNHAFWALVPIDKHVSTVFYKQYL